MSIPLPEWEAIIEVGRRERLYHTARRPRLGAPGGEIEVP